MNIFTPFTFAFRTVNAIGTAYVCGKVGMEAYKQVRSMQKEAMTAKQLRERFVSRYTAQKGTPPTEEEVQIALSSYNAVEKPVQHRIKTFVSDVGEKLERCIDGKWLEDLVRLQPPEESVKEVKIDAAKEEKDEDEGMICP